LIGRQIPQKLIRAQAAAERHGFNTSSEVQEDGLEPKFSCNPRSRRRARDELHEITRLGGPDVKDLEMLLISLPPVILAAVVVRRGELHEITRLGGMC
jgi:hypothetical protein